MAKLEGPKRDEKAKIMKNNITKNKILSKSLILASVNHTRAHLRLPKA